MAKATKKPRGAKKQPRPEEFGLTLGACRVFAFNIETPAENPIGKEITYQLSLRPSPAPDPSIALFVLEINGLLASEQPETPPVKVFGLTTLTLFQYSGLDSLEKDADGTVLVPEWVNTTIVSILIGSARGILMEKLASTIYKDAVLPIIGMHSMGSGIAISPAMMHGV